ncbi:siderophore-interacting protein [Limoniibacter endophyticus]|uniref:NADPH-dependent ferric siderophore reductase n=1 Tax=Limoniibacter endophyticus TaxID=1565040 RepID=A0A8J3GHA6_9HYPH|nr:siderophore-interacting protein [Limoniibacter endophyticus]GHC73621.1 NADPH-dependent ferric siderophore reductase [Limoniibacter endophyticus]
MLQAASEIYLDDPVGIAERLCRHYNEHGTASMAGTKGLIETIYGRAFLVADDGRLSFRVEADDDTSLIYMKMGMIHHLREFAGDDMATLAWTGDGLTGGYPPFFREMKVVEAYDITPKMRRVVLKGENLERFTHNGLHIRLIFPPEGRKPVWPVLGTDGCPIWPEGEDALTARVYTIRSLDLVKSEMAVDILRHDGDSTPGSAFAIGAKPGDVVGVTGPGGGGIPDSGSLFLFGDETAIPAIARILEDAGHNSSIRAYIEVADEFEEQSLTCKGRCDIEWLYRARGERLVDAATAVTLDQIGDDTFFWAACEFCDFKTIRKHCRTTLKLPRERHLVVAYWRKDLPARPAKAA